MATKSVISFVDKKQLAAWGILAACFVALIAFHMKVWAFVAVSALFIGYISWTATAFLVRRQDFSGRKVAAWALPVSLAIVQALVCFGLAWLVLWMAHQLFRF